MIHIQDLSVGAIESVRARTTYNTLDEYRAQYKSVYIDTTGGLFNEDKYPRLKEIKKKEGK